MRSHADRPRVAEGLAKVPAKRTREFLSADLRMAQTRDRSHFASGDPTRHYRLEVGEVGRNVKRKAVIGDPSANSNADRSDLSRPNPYPGQFLAPRRCDSVLRERADHHLLEVAQIPPDVARRAFQLHDWIAHCLSGAVVGDLSAARDAHYRHPRASAKDEAVVSAAAESVDLRMLEQQERVTDFVARARRDQCLLEC